MGLSGCVLCGCDPGGFGRMGRVQPRGGYRSAARGNLRRMHDAAVTRRNFFAWLDRRWNPARTRDAGERLRRAGTPIARDLVSSPKHKGVVLFHACRYRRCGTLVRALLSPQWGGILGRFLLETALCPLHNFRTAARTPVLVLHPGFAWRAIPVDFGTRARFPAAALGRSPRTFSCCVVPIRISLLLRCAQQASRLSTPASAGCGRAARPVAREG